VPEISALEGVAKSTVLRWIGDLPPLEEIRGEPLRTRVRRDHPNIERRRAMRDAERQHVKALARAEVGSLSPWMIVLLGAVLYWAEGHKDKPYARRERVIFSNSDPGLVRLFLAFLDAVGVPSRDRRFRVAIHESADERDAVLRWAGTIGADPEQFSRSTIKRHKPTTNRLRTGEDYVGVLVVSVLHSADLYRRISGWLEGVLAEIGHSDVPRLPESTAAMEP
jgi:hypothetical protein